MPQPLPTEVQELVDRLSKETGEEPSKVLVRALRERLARVSASKGADDAFARMMEISRQGPSSGMRCGF